MSSGTVGIEYARLVQEDCARKVGSRVSFHAVDMRDLANTVIAQFEQMAMVREYLNEMSSRARRERRYGLANDLKQAAEELTPKRWRGHSELAA